MTMAGATTTPKVQSAIQASDAPAWALAEWFGTTQGHGNWNSLAFDCCPATARRVEGLVNVSEALTLDPFGVLAPDSGAGYTENRLGGKMTKLPVILEREPLVDAVFEVRLGGDPHMSDLLPGVLFGQLDPKPTIQRLPAAEIPQPIRASDPISAVQ